MFSVFINLLEDLHLKIHVARSRLKNIIQYKTKVQFLEVRLDGMSMGNTTLDTFMD